MSGRSACGLCLWVEGVGELCLWEGNCSLQGSIA